MPLHPSSLSYCKKLTLSWAKLSQYGKELLEFPSRKNCSDNFLMLEDITKKNILEDREINYFMSSQLFLTQF